MKQFVFSATLVLLGSTASAQVGEISFPDFSLEGKYERSVIKGDAAVQAYAARLGAKSFKVTDGKASARMYAVETNNGCSFDVEVVYKSWPGVDDVLVYNNAVCR